MVPAGYASRLIISHDVRYFGAADEIRPLFYVPHRQDSWGDLVVTVRAGTSGSVDVQRLVLRRTLVLLGVGLLAGTAGALAVFAWDPAAFATGAFVLAAVALLAGYLPAWRAARLGPMVALRSE